MGLSSRKVHLTLFHQTGINPYHISHFPNIKDECWIFGFFAVLVSVGDHKDIWWQLKPWQNKKGQKFVALHSAPTEGVMHLFHQNWWFWLIFANFLGHMGWFVPNYMPETTPKFFWPPGGTGGQVNGGSKGASFLKICILCIFGDISSNLSWDRCQKPLRIFFDPQGRQGG